MISIQTNVNSLVAQQNLGVNSAFQSKTIAQLTSGYRINQSGDDAAGLAVANKFRSTVAELTQGVANGNDATAQLQIMDGGMSNISAILDRLKTLATQSASGTFTGNRTTVNSEFQNDLLEIDRQAQSIGLNTGGAFAKNLDVYLGAGSGSQSLANGVVTLGLAQSAVDSQSLGLRGLEAVNLTSGSLAGNNAGTDLGASSATSVQNIIANTTGVNANQQAVAGYAALQFSGAGFSDAGKIGISLNLAGVTDVSTLVAAVNGAIQTAGNGTTAAATAFKNANIVASLHTDSAGGQQLAFSSGTAAFQVQAGDQMANALLGNVSVVGGVAKGVAVAGSTVTGVTTKDGNFASTDIVKLVVTGGGLASPVTLQLNTGTTGVSTSGAITDLKNQFSGSAELQAAGLSMSGSSTVGGTLSFASAVGQTFNVQVTGDAANLLGLGSFLADSTGNADYTKITAATAYNASALTGTASTTGLAAGLEVSLNGAQSVAMSAIDLTAGAHALTASTTSTASIGSGAGTVDVLATNNQVDITVVNNGISNHQAWGLDLTSQVASLGKLTFTDVGMNRATFAGFDSTTGTHNSKFMVAVDGKPAVEVTLSGNYAATTAGADLFVAALDSALNAAGVDAAFDTTSHDLVLSSRLNGPTSSVAVSAATYASAAVNTASALTEAQGAALTVTSGTNDQFDLAVNGLTKTVTVAGAAYVDKDVLLGAIQTGLDAQFGGSSAASHVVASWGTAGTDIGNLTLTTKATGAAASIVVSATSGKPAGFSTATGFKFQGGTLTASGSDAAVDGGLATIGLDGSGTPPTSTPGTNDAPTTAASIAAQIQTKFGNDAKVTISNDYKITIESAVKGANSSVTVGTAVSNDANTLLHLTAATTKGTNSSIGDIVDNLNAQFAASTTFQNAGLTAAATAADGTGTGSFVTIQSTNNTQFRLNSVGATSVATAGAIASTASNQGTWTPVTVSAAAANNQFKIAIDNGSAITLTLADATYSTAAAFLTAVQGAIANTGGNTNSTSASITSQVTAGFDATSGALTLTSATTGAASKLVTSGVTYASTARTVSSITGTGMGNDVIPSITFDANNHSIDISGNTTGAFSGTITMDNGSFTSVADLVGAINAKIGGGALNGKVHAIVDSNNHLAFETMGTSSTGSTATVTVAASGSNPVPGLLGFTAGTVSGANAAVNTGLTNFGFAAATNSGHQAQVTEDTGFGVKGSSFTAGAPTSATSTMSVLDAFGVSNSTAFTFSAMKYGSDKQALTFSATDNAGTLETKTITLQNSTAIGANRAGVSIDSAVAYINQQLQQLTSSPALQKIVAVKENAGGQEKINFVSSLSNFTVGVAATANADGVNGGAATQQTSAMNGTGANMAVDTQAGAKAAVSAIVSAVSALGAAQAAVGKGQNQLSYAVSLAQSQITNFSAAESQIRDANVAQQAANLSKAQVLSQASIAAMAQANSAPQAVLSLLRG